MASPNLELSLAGRPSQALPQPSPWALLATHEPRDWQGIWLAMESRDWHTLAVVPASAGIPSLALARMMTVIVAKHGRDVVGLADLRFVEPKHAHAYLEVVARHASRGERIVIAVSSCAENLATVPLVRAADCALLCVSLGATCAAEADRSIRRIGREHFLGTVLVHEDRPIVPLKPWLRWLRQR